MIAGRQHQPGTSCEVETLLALQPTNKNRLAT